MNTESDCLREGMKLADIQELMKIILVKQFGIMQLQAKKYKESIGSDSRVSAEVIEGEMAKLKRQRFNSYEKFKNGNISREELDEIRDAVAKRMKELEVLSNNMFEQAEISEVKTHKADIILNYTDEDEFSEDFIKYFVKKVEIYNDKQIKITWNFGLDEFLNEKGECEND